MEDNSHMFEDEKEDSASIKKQWKSMPKGMPENAGSFSAEINDDTLLQNQNIQNSEEPGAQNSGSKDFEPFKQNSPNIAGSYTQNGPNRFLNQQNGAGGYQNQPNGTGGYQNQPNGSGRYQNQPYSANNYQNQQNKAGFNNQYGRAYNPYANPSFSHIDPKTGRRIKSDSTSCGTAALILGVIALSLFLTYINIVLAVIALILGVAQITTCKKKGLAIVGIVTAALSITLTIASTALIGNRLVDSFKSSSPDDIIYFNDDENIIESPEDIQEYIDNYFNNSDENTL